MSNPKVPLLVGALLAPLLLAASPALGQEITIYDNETDYALAAGATFGTDVTFGSPEASDPTLVNWSSDAISDAGSTLSPNGVGPVDGTFAGSATAFKFTFLSNGNAATVELYDVDGNFLGGLPAPNAPGFFGVVSSFPIHRFVIRPGEFLDGTGNLDRFFIDDFCASGLVGAPPGEPPPPPPPPPPPAADLSTMCHDLAAAVAAADPSAFRNRNRQNALANKLAVVCRKIDAGDADSLRAALHKLEHDILKKMDGEKSPQDWVTVPAVQKALADQVDALVAAIEDAIGEAEAANHGHGKK
jgi:hypothetical protein